MEQVSQRQDQFLDRMRDHEAGLAYTLHIKGIHKGRSSSCVQEFGYPELRCENHLAMRSDTHISLDSSKSFLFPHYFRCIPDKAVCLAGRSRPSPVEEEWSLVKGI